MRWIKRLFHYCRNRFRYSNFFTKMVALFLVAAFLPLFVCSAFLVTDTIRVSGKNTAASIRNNFQQTYTSLENRLTQVKKCADLLLNDAGINDFLRNGKNETTFWEQRTFKTDMDNTISFIENAQNIKRLRVYVDPAYFYILDSYHYCSMNLLSGQSWFTPLRLAKGRSIWLSSQENDLLDQAQNIDDFKVENGIAATFRLIVYEQAGNIADFSSIINGAAVISLVADKVSVYTVYLGKIVV